jgi:hypothetical protein
VTKCVKQNGCNENEGIGQIADNYTYISIRNMGKYGRN